MAGIMDLWRLEPVEENNRIILSAATEISGKKRYNLSFHIPIEHKNRLTTTCEPFVLATLFDAMKSKANINVHGTVSPSLLRNLEEFQAVWVSCFPEVYSQIEIKAEHELESTGGDSSNKAIMAFSGGLDSCFTAFRHKKKLCGRQNCDVSTGVMVHGFDIPLHDERTFNNVTIQARKILDSIGIELITISTNFREFDDMWEQTHGAAVAACLTLFQNCFRCGLIAGTFPYINTYQYKEWGSNPLTDPFLSSDNFKIIHDGAMFNREQKLSCILDWPEAIENLRVCWEGDQLDSNCCKCEKCIRSILTFHALGIKPANCFEHDVTLRQIDTLHIPDFIELEYYKSILDTARKNKVDKPWVNSLENCVRRNERWLNGKGIAWKKFRSKVALRTRIRKLYENSLNRRDVTANE